MLNEHGRLVSAAGLVRAVCVSLPPDGHVDDDEQQQSEGGHPTAHDQCDGRELCFIHVLEKRHTQAGGIFRAPSRVLSTQRYSALTPTGVCVCVCVCIKPHMHTGARGYQTGRLLFRSCQRRAR